MGEFISEKGYKYPSTQISPKFSTGQHLSRQVNEMAPVSVLPGLTGPSLRPLADQLIDKNKGQD